VRLRFVVYVYAWIWSIYPIISSNLYW